MPEGRESIAVLKREGRPANEERWTTAVPGVLGEISSEATPEPIAPLLLYRIAAKGNGGKKRPLPRIASPDNQQSAIEDEDGMECIPRPLMTPALKVDTRGSRGGNRRKSESECSQTVEARGFRKRRDRENRRRANLLEFQPNCYDCQQPMSVDAGSAHACFDKRDDAIVLVCQLCRGRAGRTA